MKPVEVGLAFLAVFAIVAACSLVGVVEALIN